MENKPDVMGIYYWMDEGVRHYRCRGIGPKYMTSTGNGFQTVLINAQGMIFLGTILYLKI